MPCGPVRRQQRRQRADARAGLELALGPRTVIDHLAAELVAEHDVAGEIHRLAAGMLRQLDHAVGVLARMQVGAADAAGQRLDQHLACAGFGSGMRVDDDLAVPENRSAHPAPPVSVGAVDSDEAGRGELAIRGSATLFQHQKLRRAGCARDGRYRDRWRR